MRGRLHKTSLGNKKSNEAVSVINIQQKQALSHSASDGEQSLKDAEARKVF